MEQIEKASDAQLAREIEVALPVELSRAEQLALVRSFVKDNFVAEGMCADFALHDKSDGNPHAHILLTIRPLRPDGKWGPKCRKVYDLDSQGNRIPDGKGGWKNHREDTTDWNNRDNAEKWRAAWATYANRALEAADRSERIDHRSYERQGIDKIPSIHMGVAASQMEHRPDGSPYCMTPAQRKRANSLIRRECCNCDSGNCLALDDGDTCACPQMITFSVCCKWFRWAVLPLNGTLEAEIYRDKDLKRCAVCGGMFVPKSNRGKYCPDCAVIWYKKS